MDDGVTSVSDLAGRVRAAAPELGGVRLVCVDGPAGSGKTTLARRLATALAGGWGGPGEQAGRPGGASRPAPASTPPADASAAGLPPSSALEVIARPGPGIARPGAAGATGREIVPGTAPDQATSSPPAVVILHLDDLYEGWSGLDGVWPRLEQQVLGPLGRGEAGRYQQYDWAADRFAGWVDVPVPAVLVVEGCGSAPRAVGDRAVLVVWVEAPSDVRLGRGLERDGRALRDQWLRWMALEEAHFDREGTRGRADVVVDGCAPLDP